MRRNDCSLFSHLYNNMSHVVLRRKVADSGGLAYIGPISNKPILNVIVCSLRYLLIPVPVTYVKYMQSIKYHVFDI